MSLHQLRAMSDGDADLSRYEIHALREATKCSVCRFDKRCSSCACRLPRALVTLPADGDNSCKDCGKALCEDCLEQAFFSVSRKKPKWNVCDFCEALVCRGCTWTCADCKKVMLCYTCRHDDVDENLCTYNGGKTYACERCFEKAYERDEFIICDECYECFGADTDTQRCSGCSGTWCSDCVEQLELTFAACRRCGENLCEGCAERDWWRGGGCASCSVCGKNKGCAYCCNGRGVKCEECWKSYACGACQAKTAYMQQVDGKTRCVTCAQRCQSTT